MKYIRQFLIILAISFIGELLKYVLPLPIPASIYGMAILFVCLMTGWIKLEAVKETGKFLIQALLAGIFRTAFDIQRASYRLSLYFRNPPIPATR